MAKRPRDESDDEPITILPAKQTTPGWPQELRDIYGDDYWLLRDGTEAGCLYGKIADWETDEKPVIDPAEQFRPVPQSTRSNNVRMIPEPWTDVEGLAKETYVLG